MRDMKKLYWTGETVRNSQQLWETVGDMQEFYGTRRDIDREPATLGNIERHAPSP